MRRVTKRFEGTRSHANSERTAQSRWFELGEQLCISGFRQSPDRTVWTFRVQDGPEFEADEFVITACTERLTT